MGMVTLEHVHKKIGSNAILQNVHIDLEEGKIHAFYGPNGSGKSMLFRVICGLIKPTSGKVIVQGKTLHDQCSFPDSIGVIIESPGFWSRYTGLDNLKMIASIKNIIQESDIRKAIVRVGLHPDDKRPYRKYSLGMKQRLAIAQAIMEKPDILLLDEPTNALDEDGIELIRNIIMEEKSRGATIVMTSHHKEDIERLADDRFRMNQGRLYPEGSQPQ